MAKIRFSTSPDWDAEAERLAQMVRPPARPISVAHLGVAALIGRADDPAMAEIPLMVAAAGCRVLGEARAGGVMVVMVDDEADEARSYFSAGYRRMALALN